MPLLEAPGAQTLTEPGRQPDPLSEAEVPIVASEIPSALPGERGRVCMLLHKPVLQDSRVRREARTLQRAGYAVTVIQLAPPETAQPVIAEDGYAVRSVTKVQTRPGDSIRARHAAYLRAFVGEIVRARPSVIHAHDTAMLVPGVAGMRLMNARLVYDSHELATGVAYRSGVWSRFVSNVERLGIPHCSAVLTVSEGIATELERRYRLPARPTVVRNVSDLEESTASSGQGLRERLGLRDVPLALHQGAPAVGRGCESLIRAVATMPDVHLVFLGDGQASYVGRLRGLTRSLGTSRRVHFVPSLPLRDLLATTAEADVGLSMLEGMCANHHHALPNKVFEYIAAHVPVVASHLPEVRRLIEDHGVGATVDPGDPRSIAHGIRSVLDTRHDGPLRDRLREASTTLRWPVEAARLLDLYASLEAEQIRRRRLMRPGSYRSAAPSGNGRRFSTGVARVPSR